MAAKVKRLPRRGGTIEERVYLIEIFKGMWRGRHRLTTHPDGSPRCVACFMCQTNCPAHCIMIKAGTRTDGVTEKMPVQFTIDLAECIYCGYCVEACPLDAIRMDTGIYACTAYDRENMKVEIDELLSLKGGFDEDEYQKGLGEE